jgi:hypothetical protein
VQTDHDERLGLLIYPSNFAKRPTKGRPSDENRGQLRLGGEDKWLEEHPVAFDVAGVDTTLVVGVDSERDIFIGLDPRLWDPLPLGISYYAKDADLAAMGAAGWHAWEKVDRPGKKRDKSRSDSGLEAMVAFAPDRFLDFVRFERGATDLGLDTPLRLTAAQAFKDRLDESRPSPARHALEEQFDLNSTEILEIIAGRSRLSVAVRGGVAEHHLERQLRADKRITSVARLDKDGQHDFDVTLASGWSLGIECKNASPESYANGDFRVEVQKTRASKNDPASRFYKVTEFDVVAACVFAATGKWTFMYARTSNLAKHSQFEDRLAAMQRVDDTWVKSLHDLDAS